MSTQPCSNTASPFWLPTDKTEDLTSVNTLLCLSLSVACSMPANVAPTPEELDENKPSVAGVKPIPPPPNEDKRMETIRMLGLDAQKYPPDPMLNAMCSTVSKLMDVPMVGEYPPGTGTSICAVTKPQITLLAQLTSEEK